MTTNRQLKILGCVPTLLNVLMELAQEAKGYDDFLVVQNIKVDLQNNFRPLPNWQVDFTSELDFSTFLSPDNDFALSVVGTKSKEVVFKLFSEAIKMPQERFINLVHPSAYVSPSVHLNHGLQLEPLSTIAAMTELGFAVNIKRNSTVGHHCKVGDYVTINPGVIISGKVNIGNNTMIGSGAVIKDGITIGENTVIGAGSVVVKDIPANVIAYGNPCRVHKEL